MAREYVRRRRLQRQSHCLTDVPGTGGGGYDVVALVKFPRPLIAVEPAQVRQFDGHREHFAGLGLQFGRLSEGAEFLHGFYGVPFRCADIDLHHCASAAFAGIRHLHADFQFIADAFGLQVRICETRVAQAKAEGIEDRLGITVEVTVADKNVFVIVAIKRSTTRK